MANTIFTGEWFPYYFKRFEMSDRVALMTLEEEGAYHRAIRIAWAEGSIPANPKILAAKIQKGCSEEVAKTVLESFTPMPENPARMVHKTVEQVRREQKQKYLSLKTRGKLGAAKRWETKDENSSAIAQPSSGYSSAIAELRQDIDIEKDKEKNKEEEEELRDGKLAKIDASPSAPKTKRGSRLPDDFELTPEMIDWAIQKRPGVDLAEETEKFTNYFQSAPGSKGLKLDWVKTWRNWILNAGVKNNGRQFQTARERQTEDLRQSIERENELRRIGLEKRAAARRGLPRGNDADNS
jgi:hypothetical protein